MDTTLLDENFPKVYFYEKYKYVGNIKSKTNQLLGCIVAEIEAVRPWEVPTYELNFIKIPNFKPLSVV